jgi:hypothetical protein
MPRKPSIGALVGGVIVALVGFVGSQVMGRRADRSSSRAR